MLHGQKALSGVLNQDRDAKGTEAQAGGPFQRRFPMRMILTLLALGAGAYVLTRRKGSADAPHSAALSLIHI